MKKDFFTLLFQKIVEAEGRVLLVLNNILNTNVKIFFNFAKSFSATDFAYNGERSEIKIMFSSIKNIEQFLKMCSICEGVIPNVFLLNKKNVVIGRSSNFYDSIYLVDPIQALLQFKDEILQNCELDSSLEKEIMEILRLAGEEELKKNNDETDLWNQMFK